MGFQPSSLFPLVALGRVRLSISLQLKSVQLSFVYKRNAEFDQQEHWQDEVVLCMNSGPTITNVLVLG